MIIDSDDLDQELPSGTVTGGAQGGLSEAVFNHWILQDYLARGVDVNRPRDVVLKDMEAKGYGSGADGEKWRREYLNGAIQVAPGHMIGIFGYVGDAYRSVELDREMEGALRGLGLGDDGIALILTSKVGRMMIEEVVHNGKTLVQAVLAEAATIIDIDRGEFWGHPLLLGASIKLGDADDDVPEDYLDLWNAAVAMCDAAGDFAVGEVGEGDRWRCALREKAVRGDLSAYRAGDGPRATLYFKRSEIEDAARKVQANAERPALFAVGEAS